MDLQTMPSLDRWDMERAYSPQMPPSQMTIYSRFGAYMDGIDQFDCNALRLTKAEAVATDPQQRMLMEHFFTAMHDAEHRGVAVGASTGTYSAWRLPHDHPVRLWLQ